LGAVVLGAEEVEAGCPAVGAMVVVLRVVEGLGVEASAVEA